MTRQYGRFERGMRVDQPDFQNAVTDVNLLAVAQLFEALVFGTDTTLPGYFVGNAFVPSGTGGVVTITRNSGFFIGSYRLTDGTIQKGIVLAGGPTSLSVDVSGLSGSFSVWVRFNLREDAFENRFFWDPNGSPPTESQRTIATRFAETWEVTVESVSPGPEWVEVATISAPGGTIVTDERRGLWEDPIDTGTLVGDSDWGDANDRSDLRSLHGIFSMPRWVKAVQRQLQDIIGSNRWYATIGAGADLTSLLAGIQQVASNAGDLIFSSPNPRNFTRALIAGASYAGSQSGLGFTATGSILAATASGLPFDVQSFLPQGAILEVITLISTASNSDVTSFQLFDDSTLVGTTATKILDLSAIPEADRTLGVSSQFVALLTCTASAFTHSLIQVQYTLDRGRF